MRAIAGAAAASLMLFGTAEVSGADAIELFDGRSLAGWIKADGKPAEAGQGWVIEDGCLHRKSGGGDLLSAKEFGDFDLEFEWKVAEGANSGVKYRVGRFDGALLGMEYQILDDANHSNGKVEKTSCASFYDVLPPSADKEVKPVGEFNHSRIVARGSRFEHWLNGKKVLVFDTASEEFARAKAASKFRGVEEFAHRPTGRLLLQDHGDAVWFRNIRITELDAESGDDDGGRSDGSSEAGRSGGE